MGIYTMDSLFLDKVSMSNPRIQDIKIICQVLIELHIMFYKQNCASERLVCQFQNVVSRC